MVQRATWLLSLTVQAALVLLARQWLGPTRGLAVTLGAITLFTLVVAVSHARQVRRRPTGEASFAGWLLPWSNLGLGGGLLRLLLGNALGMSGFAILLMWGAAAIELACSHQASSAAGAHSPWTAWLVMGVSVSCEVVWFTLWSTLIGIVVQRQQRLALTWRGCQRWWLPLTLPPSLIAGSLWMLSLGRLTESLLISLVPLLALLLLVVTPLASPVLHWLSGKTTRWN